MREEQGLLFLLFSDTVIMGQVLLGTKGRTAHVGHLSLTGSVNVIYLEEVMCP